MTTRALVPWAPYRAALQAPPKKPIPRRPLRADRVLPRREPDGKLRLYDRLSGECRAVEDPSPANPCPEDTALLGRVVDHGGESRFCGFHPRGLPALLVDDLGRCARGRLRRKRDVQFGRYLIRRWEEMVGRVDRTGN